MNKMSTSGGGKEGREGDWECNGCSNRNYAFRSFCNRCKQPRLLVDTKTPSDSKWLPRIGDWICTGCTNNNYASRERCKKCGQPKEIAAMPAIAIHGDSLATHPSYFSRVQGGQPLPLTSNWSVGGADGYGNLHANGYGLQAASMWPPGVINSSGVSYTSQTNQPYTTSTGWRNGDWICACGFHNYSSREQCKKCNASMPSAAPSSMVSAAVPALGTKRLASEELVHHWDNKRLNAGHQPYPVVESAGVSGVNLPSSIYPTFSSGVPVMPSNVQVNLHVPHAPAVPTILGKGAKQWRSGDWMCTNCNNHNYASRSHCNRCKTQREMVAQSVSVA